MTGQVTPGRGPDHALGVPAAAAGGPGPLHAPHASSATTSPTCRAPNAAVSMASMVVSRRGWPVRVPQVLDHREPPATTACVYDVIQQALLAPRGAAASVRRRRREPGEVDAREEPTSAFAYRPTWWWSTGGPPQVAAAQRALNDLQASRTSTWWAWRSAP
ncbi:hypothetical protein QJS66_02830 [Kocuria rhizophila]|nr:hypothetical protein QJS66_02830 [Kocuria rhizophila]